MEYLKHKISFTWSLCLVCVLCLILFTPSSMWAVYLIVGQGHYFLTYIWTLKSNRQPFLSLLIPIILFGAIYYSPASTKFITTITSLMFLYHFWKDELRLHHSPVKGSFWQLLANSALWFLGLLILLQFFAPEKSNLQYFMQLLPLQMSFMSLVIFHGLHWYFYMTVKYVYKKYSWLWLYFFSLLLVNIFLVHFYFESSKTNLKFQFLFGPREFYTWGMLHMCYTYLKERFNQSNQFAKIRKIF